MGHNFSIADIFGTTEFDQIALFKVFAGNTVNF